MSAIAFSVVTTVSEEASTCATGSPSFERPLLKHQKKSLKKGSLTFGIHGIDKVVAT